LDWAILSLFSSITLSIIIILDKRLISVKIDRIEAYYAWLALSMLFISGFVYLIWGFGDNLNFTKLLTAYGGGLFWGAGLVLFFLGVKKEEASRAAAIFQTFPLFVFLFAVTFLGENILLIQMIAIVSIVVGAAMISLGKVSLKGIFKPSKALPLLVFASFFVGVGFFVNKLALDMLPVATVYIFRAIGMATTLLVFFRPSLLFEMFKNMKDTETRNLLILNPFILAPLAVAFMMNATSRGPVSLVSVIIATSPMFVFLFTVGLSKTKLWRIGEPLVKDVLLVKGVSVGMIVAGIIILQIT